MSSKGIWYRRALEELVEGDGKVAHALAGRVVDRVRERRGDAGDADLADAARAERIELLVILVDESDVDLTDVGVDRNVVVGEIAIDEAP